MFCYWEMGSAGGGGGGSDSRKSLQRVRLGIERGQRAMEKVRPDQGWSNHVILSDHQ